MNEERISDLVIEAMNEQDALKKREILEMVVDEDQENSDVQLAQFLLGEMYLNGSGPVEKDRDKSQYYLTNPAKHNHATSLLYLGLIKFDKGDKDCFEYLCRAWVNGNEVAALRLERYCKMTGKEEVISRLAKETIEKYRLDVEQKLRDEAEDKNGILHHAMALYYVYELGGHDPNNIYKAKEYLEEAERLGNGNPRLILKRSGFKNMDAPEVSVRYEDAGRDFGSAQESRIKDSKGVSQADIRRMYAEALKETDPSSKYQKMLQCAGFDGPYFSIVGEAQYQVGKMLYKGEGIDRNYDLALVFLKDANAHDVTAALEYTGVIKILRRQYEDGARDLAAGTVLGNLECCLRLAWMRYNHTGGEYGIKVDEAIKRAFEISVNAVYERRTHHGLEMLGCGNLLLFLGRLLNQDKKGCLTMYDLAMNAGHMAEGQKMKDIYHRSLSDEGLLQSIIDEANEELIEAQRIQELAREKAGEENGEEKKHKLTIGKVVLYLLISLFASMIVGPVSILIFIGLILYKIMDQKKYKEKEK